MYEVMPMVRLQVLSNCLTEQSFIGFSPLLGNNKIIGLKAS